MLGGRVIEIKRGLYVCFLDNIKAFHKVRYQEMLEMLQKLDIDWKDIQQIQNLYRVQAAAIRINSEVGHFKKLQGCMSRLCVFTRLFQPVWRKHLKRIS